MTFGLSGVGWLQVCFQNVPFNITPWTSMFIPYAYPPTTLNVPLAFFVRCLRSQERYLYELQSEPPASMLWNSLSEAEPRLRLIHERMIALACLARFVTDHGRAILASTSPASVQTMKRKLHSRQWLVHQTIEGPHTATCRYHS